MDGQQEEYLTVQEVADILRVHRNTVQRLAQSGQFPGAIGIRIRKHTTWRIPQSALESLAKTSSSEVLQPLPTPDLCANPFPLLSQFLTSDARARLPQSAPKNKNTLREKMVS